MENKKEKNNPEPRKLIPTDRAVWYASYWFNVKRHFNREDQKEWAVALLEYQFEGIEPNFENPYLDAVFGMAKENMIASNVSIRNGSKGGRPKGK